MSERPILLDLPDQLIGERVVVRPFRDSDAGALFTAIDESREHLRRFLPWGDRHQDVNDSIEYVRRTQSNWALRNSFEMGIFLRDGGKFLGGAGLHPREWSIPSLEIGYWVREPAEGKGYVTEAVKLLSRLAFEQLSAQRVMIRCEPRNQRSRAIPERLGYVYEGTLRREILDADGNPRDAMVFSLIPEEFEQVRRDW